MSNELPDAENLRLRKDFIDVSSSPEIMIRTFRAGESIFQQGEQAKHYYVIIEGGVDIRDNDITLERLSDGNGFGSIAILNGHPHTVDAQASTYTKVYEIPHSTILRLIQTDPEFANQLFARIQNYMRRTLLSSVLSNIFGSMHLDSDTFHIVEQSLTWRTYQPGETVFIQGDEGDELLIVISGRFRATYTEGSDEKVLRELGRGALVGEMALLSDLPRSASVTAIRETTVVVMDRLDFDDLIAQSAVFARYLLSVIAKRQYMNSETSSSLQTKPLTYAIVPANPAVDINGFLEQLSPYLTHQGTVAVFNHEQFNLHFGVSDNIDVPKILRQQWANILEENNDFLCYVVDDTCNEWTQWTVSNADRVLIVGDATHDPTPSIIEECVFDYAPHQRYELVLLHEENVVQPQGTARWLAPRTVTRHHHVRMSDEAHFARLARLLTGNGIGVVLGGGGARGYAHIGVIKAMIEADIPIDAIGCVSMGAVVGGGLLAHLTSGDVIQSLIDAGETYGSKNALLDTTIPISAIMRSKKVTEATKGICGNLSIEDAWLPFFCISTNLSKKCLKVHREGKLHKAVRASLSIPSVFSPVIRDGDLIVDGGVINNFPVDIMRDYLEGGTVIGTVVSSSGPQYAYEIDDEIDGIRAVASRFVPWFKKKRLPSILKTILAASSVNAYIRQAEYRQQTDLLFETTTDPFGTMDFDHIWELFEMGYEAHRDNAKQWVETQPQLLEQPSQWKQPASPRSN